MENHQTKQHQWVPFVLGQTRIEPLLNQIRIGDQVVCVERQVMLLLLFLVENINQVVTRDRLHAALWPADDTNDEALTQAVSKLRKALGDCSDSGPTIETIRKVGYRLVGEVSYSQPLSDRGEKSSRIESVSSKQPKKRYSRLVLALVFFITLINGAALLTGNAGKIPRIRLVRMEIPASSSLFQEGQRMAVPLEDHSALGAADSTAAAH
ncbi:MAG: winged helix-turn-helix domain-containing protein [Bacteroidetes bacterium]|nr:winged helix-turn-helix domain-containing protein [Bacteroidota bacterium]